MSICYIYTLTNPNNGEVFYVGRTKDANRRKRSHCDLAKTKGWFDRDLTISLTVTAKDLYIHRNRIIPVFEIVDEYIVDAHTDVESIEEYWIQQFLAWGFPLTNYKGTNRTFEVHRNKL